MPATKVAPYEIAHSLDYRMRKWYDQWFVLLKMRGSVWPRALFTILLSTTVAYLYWRFVIDADPEKALIANPAAFGFYMQTAGVILAFTTSISYNRYWEALTCLSQMSASARWIASMVLSFDRDTQTKGPESDKWKASVLHVLSILHGTCIMSLNRDLISQPMEIIGALTEVEAQELDMVSDQPLLTAHWLNELLTERSAEGGLDCHNAPTVSQIWVMIGTFLSKFADAKKVASYRLPLSFHQSLAWSDLIVAFITPLCIAAFVPSLWVCLLFCFLTCAGFHGIYMACISMQQPFGHKSCDLPLLRIHRDFINGVLSIISVACAEHINSSYKPTSASDKSPLADRFCPITLAAQRTAPRKVTYKSYTGASQDDEDDSEADTISDFPPLKDHDKSKTFISMHSNRGSGHCVVIDEGEASTRVLATPVLLPSGKGHRGR